MSERYRVEQTGKGFWPYCVRAGNGTRDLYVGHKKTCDRVAAELTTAFRDGEFVGKGLYDALAAEAQALREEVARGNRIALAMALDIAAVGVALGIPGEQQEGGTGEFIEAIQSLQKELEALRARVVVTPDASTVYAALDARERLFTSPENIRVALEAQSRINGKTVSEGLLRRLIDSDGIDGIFDAQQNYAAHQELRALLNKDKENGNG